MRRMKLAFSIGAALLVFAAVRLAATQAPLTGSARRPAAPRVAHQFVGGGRWQSRATVDQRDWQVQMKHMDDNSLEGRVTLVGSRLQQARIQGQITGSEVYGVLVNDSDQQIGTFTGLIATGSISGTYTIADGDTGNWSWGGPMPAIQPVREEVAVITEPASVPDALAAAAQNPDRGPFRTQETVHRRRAILVIAQLDTAPEPRPVHSGIGHKKAG